MNQPLLQLRDLDTDIALRRGTVHALDGVSLQVSPGETLGVVGESGSGKTMTALSIMGLLPHGGRVTGGEILFEGRDLRALPVDEVRRIRGVRMGMVFQDPLTSLNPTMRIGAQVAEPLRVHSGIGKAEARVRTIDMLRRVGMPRPDRIADNYPHELSGGMRQRVAIAMALICSPRLLIADEPTTALDVTTQRQILELIDDLREEFGMAVVLVTHDLGVIAGRADRVAVMYAGRVVETAATRELFRAPRHRYTEALLEALPEAAHGERLYSIPGLPPDLSQPLTGCRFAPRCRHATDECRAGDIPLTGDVHAFACVHPAQPHSRVVIKESPAPVRELTGPPVLSVRNLVKNYPVRRGPGHVSAVADVSFEVAPGETFGLVGESGCGKSTVGRLAVGLEQPTEGQIVLSGTDIAGLTGRERRRMHRQVQLMFQDSYAAMNPRMRVDAILAEPLEIQKVGDRRTRITTLLDQVGLSRGVLERYPHEFSGGQLQRIGLARSLALQPRLIVGDEPVSALDVSIQAQVLNLLRDLQGELGLTYLFVAHNMGVVEHISDRVAVMYLGRIVEVADRREMFRNPQHPYAQALLSAIPIPNPELRRQRVILRGDVPSPVNPPPGCHFHPRCQLRQALGDPEICATQDPQLISLGATPGMLEHECACHFRGPGAAEARASAGIPLEERAAS